MPEKLDGNEGENSEITGIYQLDTPAQSLRIPSTQ
jgi:hypothetical protein